MEKGDVTNAKQMLLMSLEGNLIDMDKWGTTALDERYSSRKKKLIAEFAEERKKNAPVDYGDGGVYAAGIDAALQRSAQIKSR